MSFIPPMKRPKILIQDLLNPFENSIYPILHPKTLSNIDPKATYKIRHPFDHVTENTLDFFQFSQIPPPQSGSSKSRRRFSFGSLTTSVNRFHPHQPTTYNIKAPLLLDFRNNLEGHFSFNSFHLPFHPEELLNCSDLQQLSHWILSHIPKSSQKRFFKKYFLKPKATVVLSIENIPYPILQPQEPKAVAEKSLQNCLGGKNMPVLIHLARIFEFEKINVEVLLGGYSWLYQLFPSMCFLSPKSSLHIDNREVATTTMDPFLQKPPPTHFPEGEPAPILEVRKNLLSFYTMDPSAPADLSIRSWHQLKHILNLNAEHVSEILPFLFLGPWKTLLDPESLLKLSIHKIITVAAECPWKPHDEIKRSHYHITDSASYSYAKDLLIILKNDLDPSIPSSPEKADKNKILVNCMAGISRSATLVIAFLITRYGFTLFNALKYTLWKRPVIDPNAGFLATLALLEYSMFGASTNPFLQDDILAYPSHLVRAGLLSPSYMESINIPESKFPACSDRISLLNPTSPPSDDDDETEPEAHDLVPISCTCSQASISLKLSRDSLDLSPASSVDAR